jgi:hypothetical protein
VTPGRPWRFDAGPEPRRDVGRDGSTKGWRWEDDGLRLVMAGGTRSIWAWLEPQAPEEVVALQACAAQGDWTNGWGAEAIARLRAHAERLGYPGGPSRPVSPVPPGLVVVRRGERDLFEALRAIARTDVTVVWDRRQGQRRANPRSAAGARRRQPTPETWGTQGFLVV